MNGTYDRTRYTCNGCRRSWELVDADPWPAVRSHVEGCSATVSTVEFWAFREAGATKDYVYDRRTLGPESWAIA